MKKTIFMFQLKFIIGISISIGLIFFSKNLFRKNTFTSLQNDQKLPLREKAYIASINSSTRTIPEGLFCFNVNSTLVNSWESDKFQTAVNELEVSSLRIPGGTVANYWDWQKGGIIQDTQHLTEEPPRFVRQASAKSYESSKLENFKVGLEATSSNPIFVVNFLTSNLQSQIEFLTEAEGLDLPINHVELGNELFFNLPNYKQKFPSAQSYAEESIEWIQEIKTRFPNAKVGVLGVIPEPGKGRRIREWDSVVIENALPYADAITYHFYFEHGLNQITTQTDSYPLFDHQDISNILGEVFRNWDIIQENKNFQSIPEDKEIWITEYNLFEKIFGDTRGHSPRVMGSWLHGLYSLSMGVVFLEDPRIKLTCNHVLIGSYTFGSIFASGNSFQIGNHQVITTEAMGYSSAGKALKLLGQAMKGMNQAQQLTFEDMTYLVGQKGFQYPALYGWVFANQQNRNALVINLSEQQTTINLSRVFQKSVNYEQFFGDPRQLELSTNNSVRVNDTSPQEIVLPGYSVSRIFLSK